MYDETKIKNKDILYPEESYRIVGALQKVYGIFGGAFKESVIDKALTVELENLGFKIDSQKRIDIYYEGIKVGVYVPDKIINDIILVELKSIPFIRKEDEKQFWRYLTSTNYKLGYLVNFGPRKLEILRRVYDTARKK